MKADRMQKFYLEKNSLGGQFYFISPNHLHKVENAEKHYKQNILKEFDNYKQENHWPCPEKIIEQIQIQITNKCNYSCIHCLENASPINNDFVNFNLLLPFIKQFKQHNKNGNIVLTGGEPLLHLDIHNILIELTKLNLSLTLFSNGALINSRKFDRYFGCFDKIHLSIDGFSESVNDSIRGKGAFKTLIKTLSILKESKIPITLSCTLFEYNIDDIENNLQSFIDKYYYDNITLNFDYLRAIGRGEKFALSFEKALEYKTRVKKILNIEKSKIEIPKLGYCGYGHSITIEPNGNFYACSHPNSYIGNYSSFDDVFKKVKEEMNFMENRAKIICENCVFAWVCSGGCFLENRNSCDERRKNEALLKMKYGDI